jgi:hypothetical protein
MNIDEGKQTLEWANEFFPIREWKSVLYIGVHPLTFNGWNGDYFLNVIKEQQPDTKCVIVEINPEYVEIAKNNPVSKQHNIEYVCSDITRYVKNKKDKFDCVIWWHGPEHVEKSESLKIIKSFEKICKGIIILGCPEGHDPYEESETDKHFWDVYQNDFENLGYNTVLIDRSARGNPQPSISAIKVLNK